MAAEVAIVVPTRHRPDHLARLLAVLESQVDDSVEVVVVDDGDPGSLVEVPTWVRRLATGGAAGPAVARNLGWRATEAPLVAFVDDDVVPHARWLAAMRRAAATTSGPTIVQGVTRADHERRDRLGPWCHWTECDRDDGRYPTCNIAYDRVTLEQVGGFDEEAFAPRRALGGEVRAVWGEDTDLALRARAVGASVVLAADAVVDHDVEAGSPRSQARDARRLEGLVVLLARHGRADIGAVRGCSARATHPPALALAVALGSLTGRRSATRVLVVAVAAGWYAWACRAERPPPPSRVGWLGVVPMAWLVDCYGVAVVVRAALRHRVVLI